MPKRYVYEFCFFSGNRGKPEHSCGGWPSNLGQVDEGWPEKGDNTTVKIILKMGLIAKLLTSVLYTLHLPFQMMTLWEGWVVGWAHLCNTPCSLTQFCLLQPHQRTLDTYGAILWHQQRSWWGKPCKGSLLKWKFNQLIISTLDKWITAEIIAAVLKLLMYIYLGSWCEKVWKYTCKCNHCSAGYHANTLRKGSHMCAGTCVIDCTCSIAISHVCNNRQK